MLFLIKGEQLSVPLILFNESDKVELMFYGIYMVLQLNTDSMIRGFCYAVLLASWRWEFLFLVYGYVLPFLHFLVAFQRIHGCFPS